MLSQHNVKFNTLWILYSVTVSSLTVRYSVLMLARPCFSLNNLKQLNASYVSKYRFFFRLWICYNWNKSYTFVVILPQQFITIIIILIIGNRLFVHQRIASAAKRVEFVSDRLSYIILSGRWCNIVVLNVHEPSEEKSDESKDSFYEELEQVFFIISLSTIWKFY